jgi:hypothetical protein
MKNNQQKQLAISFAEFIDNGFWIRSSNDLWYQKSDGNPNEGITTEQLYDLFFKSNMPDNFVYKQAISLFGVINQLDMATEECAELIKAINKAKRSGLLKYIGLENAEHPIPILKDATFKQSLLYNELCGEVADVEIMTDQLRLLLNSEQIDLIKERKLIRLMNNIGLKLKNK